MSNNTSSDLQLYVFSLAIYLLHCAEEVVIFAALIICQQLKETFFVT